MFCCYMQPAVCMGCLCGWMLDVSMGKVQLEIEGDLSGHDHDKGSYFMRITYENMSKIYHQVEGRVRRMEKNGPREIPFAVHNCQNYILPLNCFNPSFHLPSGNYAIVKS